MTLLRMAQRIMSASELSSSFRMTAARWVSTVLTLSVRRRAMSLLLLPSASSCMISRSRDVSRSVARLTGPVAPAFQEALQNHFGDPAREERFVARKALHRGDKLARGIGLEKVALERLPTSTSRISSSLSCMVNTRTSTQGRDLADAPGCFEPVQLRHREVQNGDIRTTIVRLGQQPRGRWLPPHRPSIPPVPQAAPSARAAQSHDHRRGECERSRGARHRAQRDGSRDRVPDAVRYDVQRALKLFNSDSHA